MPEVSVHIVHSLLLLFLPPSCEKKEGSTYYKLRLGEKEREPRNRNRNRSKQRLVARSAKTQFGGYGFTYMPIRRRREEERRRRSQKKKSWGRFRKRKSTTRPQQSNTIKLQKKGHKMREHRRDWCVRKGGIEMEKGE